MNSLFAKNETTDLFHTFEIPLEHFSVKINWASIDLFKRNFLGLKTKKITENIDLELNCIMYNKKHIEDSMCSPKFNSWLIKNNFPLGKNNSKDNAFRRIECDNSNHRHVSGNLLNINNEIDSVFYYLNFDLRRIKSPDFSAVKSLQMTFYEDDECKKIIHQESIDTKDFSDDNNGTLIIGKLYRENKKWYFKRILQTIEENNFIKLTTGI